MTDRPTIIVAFARLKFISLHVKTYAIIRTNVTAPCQMPVFISIYLTALPSPLPDSYLICSRHLEQGGGDTPCL